MGTPTTTGTKPKRPVSLPWTCQRSGDCCRQVSQIVMTPQEAIKVRDARPDLPLAWYQHPDRRFVYLRGRPCPLLGSGDAGLAVCTVWPVRPYNCRRFGCYRPDPATEPYEPEPLDEARARLGCANLSDRLAQSRAVRRAFARVQRKAQRWARTHGWPDDLTPPQVGSNVTFYRLQRP